MMRQCNVPIQIKLLNTKEANEKAKRHNFHKFEQNVFFYKNFKRLENNVLKIRSNLPGLDVIFIPLFIQNVRFLLFYKLIKNNVRILKIYLFF